MSMENALTIASQAVAATQTHSHADSATQSDATTTATLDSNTATCAEQPHNIDVTVPLQFFVAHSTLTLPTGRKANLLGFYDVAAASGQSMSTAKATQTATTDSLIAAVCNSAHNVFTYSKHTKNLSNGHRSQSSDKQQQRASALYVRYRYAGRTYEMTFADQEQVVLPNASADCLGGSNIT